MHLKKVKSMNNVIPLPDKARIKDEAAIWLVILDRGDLCESDKKRLKHWLAAEALHRETLWELALVWGEMDAMVVLAEIFPLAKKTEKKKPLPWWKQQPLGVGLAFAASICIVIALVFAVFPNSSRDVAPVELVYGTERGTQSQVTLSDSSKVVMNTDTEIRVRFTESERAIYLLQGEAYFNVAKNPQRPFIVYAGNGQVRAVGTAFSVYLNERKSNKVDVVVSEGIIEVKAGKKVQTTDSMELVKDQKGIAVKAGGVVSYNEAIESVDYVSEQDIQKKLGWKTGKWVFKGDSLADVVAEISRYTDKTLEIVDPEIAGLRVGGYFNVGDIDPLLTALQASLGIKVNYANAKLIQLSKAESVIPEVH